MNYKWLPILLLLTLYACEPYQEDDIALGPLPEAPTMRVTLLDDGNHVVIEDVSDGFFSRVWDLPGGQPNHSTEAYDTIFYSKAGTYNISLYAAKSGGNGSAATSQTITIAQDAVGGCSDEVELLAGGCNDGDEKCWTFSHASGAVGVGPFPGSREWYNSPLDGLQAEQYDDRFCFAFSGSRFYYDNAGATIDPWNGYAPVPYDPPNDHTYTLVPGGGESGELRIILTEGSFMGVWDASNIYDVVKLTETELVVRSPFLNGSGWFELTFVKS